MYTYICEGSVLFPTYLFVRALFGNTLRILTRDVRPEILVAIVALSSARRVLRFFFPARGDKAIPWCQYERLHFVRTHR